MIIGTLSDADAHSCDCDGCTAWPINIVQPFIIVNPSPANEPLFSIFHHSACRRWSNMWTLLDWWGALIVSGKLLGVLGLFFPNKKTYSFWCCMFPSASIQCNHRNLLYARYVSLYQLLIHLLFVDFPDDPARTVFSLFYCSCSISEECIKNYMIEVWTFCKYTSGVESPARVVCLFLRGASKGEGLGNQFLGNIRNVGAARCGVCGWWFGSSGVGSRLGKPILSGTDLNQSTSSLVDRTFTALPQQDVRCHCACHSMLWWRGCWKLRAFFGSPGYLTWGIFP